MLVTSRMYEPASPDNWSAAGRTPKRAQSLSNSPSDRSFGTRELYAELDGPELVNRLIEGEFPLMNPEDPIDGIISECWRGQFGSIAELSRRVRQIAVFDKNLKFEERKSIGEQHYNMSTRQLEP